MSDIQPPNRYRQLVEQLHHPQTRRTARQELVAAKAVEPLLECLGVDNESVVWAAVESLCELKAVEAIGPLLELLEKGTLVLDVCEALRSITGQDFGTDLRRWREWSKTADVAKKPASDMAEIIRRAGGHLGVEPEGSGKSYRLKLSLPEGRSQKVAVYFGREDADGEELVVIYSECGPADAKYYEAVLRKNLSIPAGAFAVRDIDGKPHFVIVGTMPATTVTPTALAKCIENIATRADAVEKSLTKEDKR